MKEIEILVLFFADENMADLIISNNKQMSVQTTKQR